jgi:hypothetical protein
MIKLLSVLIIASILSGCTGVMERSLDVVNNAGPARLQNSPNPERLDAVPPLDGQKIRIVGYDSNVAVGGAGARYLGVGAQTEYRVDTVTVVMRLVSVSTGKVLLSVATEKTIASYRSGADIFRFLDLGTKLVESETGYSVNEPVNYAVREAIEAGVIELIYEGRDKELWKFKGE